MDINAVIARINELAAKNKTVGLTEEELEERGYYTEVLYTSSNHVESILINWEQKTNN